MLAVLPPEIWDEIIDHLEYDYEPLAACARVCRQWNPRANFLLLKWVTFCDMEDVRHVAKIARANGSKGPRLILLAGGRKPERGPITHLAAFAAMFAGRWTRVVGLLICSANWAMGDIRMDAFLDISTFTSITALNFLSVTFPTPISFAHLICSLENLAYLRCSELRFSVPYTNPLVLPIHIRTFNLRELCMDGRCPMVDIIDIFRATKIGDHIECVRLDDYHLPSEIDETVTHAVNHVLKNMQSLRDLTFGIDLSYEPKHAMKPLDDHHLFLGQSSKLETLHVNFQISAEYSDYHLLADTLSRITCDSIRTIQLWAIWRGGSGSDGYEAICNGLIASLDPESCAHLEEVFALPALEKLEEVVFKSYFGGNEALQIAWEETVQSRFPKLHSRGILRFTYRV